LQIEDALLQAILLKIEFAQALLRTKVVRALLRGLQQSLFHLPSGFSGGDCGS